MLAYKKRLSIDYQKYFDRKEVATKNIGKGKRLILNISK